MEFAMSSLIFVYSLFTKPWTRLKFDTNLNPVTVIRAIDTIPPMDRERQIIRIFLETIGSNQPDHDFETDSKPFHIGSEKLLFSTDEFSAEDQFRDHDAYSLGWNVVAATLSDILAAGGVPAYFGHAVTVQKDWENNFLQRFSLGVSNCLEEASTEFLGGDVGIGEKWSYTGIAIGKQEVSLNRRGAEKGDVIFMTGMAGAGNLEAALRLYSEKKSLKPLLNKVSIRFPLRLSESRLIQKYARCCIDTSDGMMRALEDLSRINQTGFLLSGIPYRKDGLAACTLLGKPRELLFLGECGEYELLFTVPPDLEVQMTEEARTKGLTFTKVGIVTSQDTKLLNEGSKTIDLNGFALYARNYPDTGEYIQKLVEFVRYGKK